MTKTSNLGHRPVNRIGFGAMQLAGPGVMGPARDPEAAAAVLKRAIELGVDHIDTSQYYGPDTVNQLIHDTLHPYPEGLALVTKLGARRDDKGGWIKWDEPDDLKQGLEDNLRTLEVDRLALANLRVMDEQSDVGVPRPEQLDAMVELRDSGKIEMIGLSNVTAEGVQLALDRGVEVGEVQNAYSVVNREHEDVLDLCREHGIAFVPFFPLGSAFSGGPKALAADDAIANVATKHGVLPTQIALAWLLAHYDRMLLIPGTTSVGHLEENLAAADVELDDEDLQTLDGAEDIGGPGH